MAWWHTDGAELAYLIYDKLKESESGEMSLKEMFDIVDSDAKFGLRKTLSVASRLLREMEDVEYFTGLQISFQDIVLKHKR